MYINMLAIWIIATPVALFLFIATSIALRKVNNVHIKRIPLYIVGLWVVMTTVFFLIWVFNGLGLASAIFGQTAKIAGVLYLYLFIFLAIVVLCLIGFLHMANLLFGKFM